MTRLMNLFSKINQLVKDFQSNRNIDFKSAFSVGALILLAAATRLIPHPWNTTGIGALALFTGVYLSSRWLAVGVTLASLILTDLILGFHSTILYVYGAFALITLIAFSQLKEKKWSLLGIWSIASSLIFFLISNFGVWAAGGFYPKNMLGLTECFVAGIPFLGNQILGDLFYVGLLFGAKSMIDASLVFKRQI